MVLISGSSQPSWEPQMTVNTTTTSYWLNWRVLLCTIWLLACMVLASALIWRYEGSKNSKREGEETQQESKGAFYADEVWKPCIKEIHPAWLLAYRVLAFFVLLFLLIATVVVDDVRMFYFYTQWTSALVTIYFGLGSLFSIYGCNQYLNKVGDHTGLDAEQSTYVSPTNDENLNENAGNRVKSSTHHEQGCERQTAGTWAYVFQIIFQMSAGAVMLTDIVFWFIIVPAFAIKNYHNFTVLLAGMHSVNAVFLLGDAALNCLRFPWFRMAYFVLWTVIYVVFQWILHACVFIWWPYPFLDLSAPYAPVWYFAVGLMHVLCYGIFALAIRMKHLLWSKWFPQSYQCVRSALKKKSETEVTKNIEGTKKIKRPRNRSIAHRENIDFFFSHNPMYRC